MEPRLKWNKIIFCVLQCSAVRPALSCGGLRFVRRWSAVFRPTLVGNARRAYDDEGATIFCAIRFGLSSLDIGQYKLNRACLADKSLYLLNDGFYGPSLFCIMLLPLERASLHCHWCREDADDIIAYLVTWLFCVSNAISAYISVFFFLSSVFIVCSCVLRVRVL